MILYEFNKKNAMLASDMKKSPSVYIIVEGHIWVHISIFYKALSGDYLWWQQSWVSYLKQDTTTVMLRFKSVSSMMNLWWI